MQRDNIREQDKIIYDFLKYLGIVHYIPPRVIGVWGGAWRTGKRNVLMLRRSCSTSWDYGVFTPLSTHTAYVHR
jgi:hypothetical protein